MHSERNSVAEREVHSLVRPVGLIQSLTLKIRVELKDGRAELIGLLLPFMWRIIGRYGPHTVGWLR